MRRFFRKFGFMEKAALMLFCILGLNWPTVSVFADDRTDSLAVTNADWGWHESGDGIGVRRMGGAGTKAGHGSGDGIETRRKGGAGIEVGHVSLELFGSRQSISAIRYRMRRHRTFIVTATGVDADSTSALTAGKASSKAIAGTPAGKASSKAIAGTPAGKAGAAAAMNGSYFDVDSLTPVTWLKVRRRIVGSTAASELFRCNGLLRLRRRRIDIISSEPENCARNSRRWRSAIATGPVLIERGVPRWYDAPAPEATESKNATEANEATEVSDSAALKQFDGFYRTRHPRSVLGTTRDGLVYMIVVDGRSKGNAAGMTIGELTKLAVWMGLDEAINFDGGGSSTVWTAAEGVLNHPTDNKHFDHFGQRRVPNIIAVR